jgi:cytochrome P450
MRADKLGTLARWAQLGPVSRIQSRAYVSHLLTSPEAVQRVLQDNPRNYRKDLRFTTIARPALGEGLFSSDGDKWREQRRVAQPAFHRQRLVAMTSAMADAIDTMLARWQRFAASGEQFNLQAEVSRMTIDVIGRTLAGQDLLPHAESVAAAMVSTFDYFDHAFNHLFTAPLFIPTARNRAFKRAIEDIHGLVGQMIEEGRKNQSARGNDLLAMMLEANRSEPDTAGLVDNLSTFLGAGTETTAVALCWAWYLLAKHPAAHRKLRQEFDSVLGSNRPTFDDLPRLGYTRMVVDEVLRLYPPAWVIGRTAIADDQISGFHIPGGSALVMSPWLTHHNALYWENPESFDPERFTPQRSRDRPQYAYYPFGGGSRMCIGDRFSIMEQTLALAMTAQRFEVQVLHDGEPDPVFTLRPKGGMCARLASV